VFGSQSPLSGLRTPSTVACGATPDYQEKPHRPEGPATPGGDFGKNRPPRAGRPLPAPALASGRRCGTLAGQAAIIQAHHLFSESAGNRKRRGSSHHLRSSKREGRGEGREPPKTQAGWFG